MYTEGDKSGIVHVDKAEVLLYTSVLASPAYNLKSCKSNKALSSRENKINGGTRRCVSGLVCWYMSSLGCVLWIE
jgi:hypothetical protein